jgi:hypothetical protein
MTDSGLGGTWRCAAGERRAIPRFAQNDRVAAWGGRRRGAAGELELLVEEEEAGGIAGLNGERGEGMVFVVELQHAAKVNGADDVDVVKDERLIGISGGVRLLIAV